MNLFRISYTWKDGKSFRSAHTVYTSPVTNDRAALTAFCAMHPHILSARVTGREMGFKSSAVSTLSANQNLATGNVAQGVFQL